MIYSLVVFFGVLVLGTFSAGADPLAVVGASAGVGPSAGGEPSAVAKTKFNIVPNYECQVIVFVDSTEEHIQRKFMADHASGGHGGREYHFSNETQSVTVMASHNWMAVRWEQKKKLIAEGHFVISKSSDFDRVVLLKNPNNVNEQVTLDCHPESAD